MSKAKLELLQLQETVGEDLTAEFCKMACTEVQKVAKGIATVSYMCVCFTCCYSQVACYIFNMLQFLCYVAIWLNKSSLIEEADSNHNSTRPIEIMAEYFKLKQHLASASQLQDFLHSTNEAYSLMAGLLPNVTFCMCTVHSYITTCFIIFRY